MSEAPLHPQVDAVLVAIDPSRGAAAAIPQADMQTFRALMHGAEPPDIVFIEHLAAATVRMDDAGLKKATAQMRQLLELGLQRLNSAANMDRQSAINRNSDAPITQKNAIRPAAKGGVTLRKR